jgi:PAS domain S-box-containing protein
VPDGVIVVAPDGSVVEANPSAAGLFGSTRAELVGQPVEHLLPEAAREGHRRHRESYGEKPESRPMGAGLELVGIRKDGTRFFADVSLTPIEGQAGDVIAVVRDVTAHLREEARLGYLEAILSSTNDAVYSQDRDGLITEWNRAAQAMVGYRAAEVVGWRSTRLFPEGRWEEHEVVLRRVLGGDVLTDVETELLRRDGVAVPALLAVGPIRDSRGRVIGASVIARDMTEQQLILATLAESEGRLRDREAMAGVGGWVLDVATGTVQWSEELHRIHGVDPVNFDGTIASHVGLVHQDDRPALEAALARAVAAAETIETKYRVLRPDNQVRVLYCRARPVLDGRDEVVGLRGICQDITER